MSNSGDATLRIRVSPNANRSHVSGWQGDALRVRVAAPPVAGRANEAVIDTLAAFLGTPRRHIKIVRGHGSRDKVVQVERMDPAELLAKLTGSGGNNHHLAN